MKFRLFHNSAAAERTPSPRRDSGAGSERPAITAAMLERCSNPEARRLLPLERAQKLRALPLALVGDGERGALTVACENALDAELRSALRFATGREIRMLQVPGVVLDRAIFDAYHSDAQGLTQRTAALARYDSRTLTPVDGGPPQLPARGEVAEFLSSLLDHAVSRAASDLHLVPKEHGSFIEMRVHGIIAAHEEPICSLTLHRQLIARIKVLAGLDTTQRNVPLDGEFRHPAGDRIIDVRVSTMPTVYGEKAVLRLLGARGVITLDRLGLDTRIEALLREVLNGGGGTIIVSGPTGSGKSTTLYAALDALQYRGLSLTSIEDPVEMKLPQVAQTAIGEGEGRGFKACLRAVLRQDPDVIMIGEMRDGESAAIAYQAALTGHLILTSLHARNIRDLLHRLIQLGLAPADVIEGSELLICQRLMHQLCLHCRAPDEVNSERFGIQLYTPRGCRMCGESGYEGSCIAAEALRLDGSLREILLHAPTLAAGLREGASAANFIPLSEALHELLKEGRISAADFARAGGAMPGIRL